MRSVTVKPVTINLTPERVNFAQRATREGDNWSQVKVLSDGLAKHSPDDPRRRVRVRISGKTQYDITHVLKMSRIGARAAKERRREVGRWEEMGQELGQLEQRTDRVERGVKQIGRGPLGWLFGG